MTNFKLSIQYDGTNYFGWQIQPSQTTVQGIIKDKLELILQENLVLHGASRTDAKVHAKAQIANFFTEKTINSENLKNSLNKLLPLDIRIKAVEEVSNNFHSRKDAKKKLYRYYIFNNNTGSPFYRNYSWHIREKIDIELLNKLSRDLIGEHNFLSFSGQKCSAKTFNRTIYNAFWTKKKNFYIFSIVGNGFLKNMVRKIVGSLIAVNHNKEDENFIKLLLEVKDPSRAKYCAPPQGLFLEKIFYEDI